MAVTRGGSPPWLPARAATGTEAGRRGSAPWAGLLLLALTLAACEAAPEAPLEPPHLAFRETAYDFGRVAQGTPVEHRFAFTNAGGTGLTMMELRAACDCTATLAEGREIAPHAAGAVQVRFDTDAVYGPQRRTVTVYSNDPTQRAVLLTVTGEVLLDVAADPPRVYLGPVRAGVPSLRAVALHTGDETVHLGDPVSDAPQLVVQLVPAEDGDGAATLAIGTASGAPPGPFSALVRVPTTSPRHPVLRVEVAGIVTDVACDTPPARVPGAASEPGADGAAAAATGSGS